MSDFSDFVGLLRSKFSPINPAGEAEDLLDNFRMCDNQKLLKYNVEFKSLAIKADWDECTLQHRYYVGLPDQIKDVLTTQPKPRNIIELKAAAHTIDACYWEHQCEKSHSNKPAPTSLTRKCHPLPHPPLLLHHHLLSKSPHHCLNPLLPPCRGPTSPTSLERMANS